MGQKVNPIGFRVGVIRSWDSKWYAKKGYAKFLHEDLRLRRYLKSKLDNAGVAKIEIERAAQKIKVNIFTARPGLIIGKKGAGIDSLKMDIQRKVKQDVVVDIQEVRKAETNAQLIAENIAMQLKRRTSYRRAMKKAIASAIRFGVKGIKINCAGRLDGAEIARSERYSEKSVPLHTLRADIDYGFAESLTTYGIIGIKVWVYLGEVLTDRELKKEMNIA